MSVLMYCREKNPKTGHTMNANDAHKRTPGPPRMRTIRLAFSRLLALAVFPLTLLAQPRALWSEENAFGPHGGRPAPAIVGGDLGSLQYHVRDDLATWTAMEVLIPERRGAQRWLADAAGSIPWEERSSRLSVKGRRPGPQGRLVGYSQLEADREEAMSRARDSAARQIIGLVIWRLRESFGGKSLLGFEGAVKLATAEVEGAIETARVDDFEQFIDRPYGRLYRAAILVGADENFLRKITTKVERALRKGEARARVQRRVVYWKGSIAFTLTLVVAIVYGVLNAMTKGYFTWRLRFLSLLALAAAYAVLVFLRF